MYSLLEYFTAVVFCTVYALSARHIRCSGVLGAVAFVVSNFNMRDASFNHNLTLI